MSAAPRDRNPAEHWLTQLTKAERSLFVAITLLVAAAGAGAGYAAKAERFSNLPERVTAIEKTISIRSPQNDAFRDSVRNTLRDSKIASLPAKVDSLSLQVCLLRVEIRQDRNADICAGLR